MSHLKVETSLQQLVHSHRRQVAIGQQEGGERLIGSQVFFYWEIYSGNTNIKYCPDVQIKVLDTRITTASLYSIVHIFWLS